MPSKYEDLRIKCEFLDKRVKLLPCHKEMIPIWHSNGQSINAIARMLKVNKRLIQFIIYPERKEKNLQDREDRGGSMQYYEKGKNRVSMKKHRSHKKEIFNLIKQ